MCICHLTVVHRYDTKVSIVENFFSPELTRSVLEALGIVEPSKFKTDGGFMGCCPSGYLPALLGLGPYFLLIVALAFVVGASGQHRRKQAMLAAAGWLAIVIWAFVSEYNEMRGWSAHLPPSKQAQLSSELTSYLLGTPAQLAFNVMMALFLPAGFAYFLNYRKRPKPP